MAALRRARNTPLPKKVRKGARGKPYQGVCPLKGSPAQGELSAKLTEGSPLTCRAVVRDPSVTASP